MAKRKPNPGEQFINRELSWLEFNERVLREGMDESVPLLERLKFLAIVSSNLDEFFMIRVASLRRQRAARARRKDLAGMTAAAQLKAVGQRVRKMMAEQSEAIRNATERLAEHGIHLLELADLVPEQRRHLASRFEAEILPSLTPLAMEDLSAAPILPGLRMYVALRLTPGTPEAPAEPDGEKFALVPVPAGQPRFLTVPGKDGLFLVRQEDAIVENVSALFAGYRVTAACPFRVTRDADVEVDEEDAEELLDAMEQAVRSRQRRAVVRLALPADADELLKDRLMAFFEVSRQDVYEIDGMLDGRALMEVASRPGHDDLKYPDWPPQPPRDLLGQEDIFHLLQERDVLLFHPYESFEPVVRLVERAADDADVLAVKMTLYRTSGDSPIIRALARAAENGKQVTVLVELKARFDEAKNVQWARRLEDAGCYVIYGIAGYKTHAKALLVIRREAHRIRRYLHLATGNYNDSTAKLYSDIGLMTTDGDLTTDAAAFFNLLTGYSQPVGWHKMTIAPTQLRRRFLEMIDREIEAATPDEPGLIMVKINSLYDREIAEALYRAAWGGVRVRLNVRGICCLKPGPTGGGDNLEVVSIVDRYLEHARIFYFRNGGHEEVYLSSADWMVRNLDKRLEILFPIQQNGLKRRLVAALETYFADNVKARRLQPDGTYKRVEASGEPVRAQERLHHEAVAATRAEPPQTSFRPLRRPQR